MIYKSYYKQVMSSHRRQATQHYVTDLEEEERVESRLWTM